MSEDRQVRPATENMAAAAEEVDVFKVPHSRMKELVARPLLEVARLPDVQDLEPSLQAVYEAMWELKSHEYIENHYIMNRLKARLHARQIYNEYVCNCHEDSVLLKVISLVEKVHAAQTQTERCFYGQLLQHEIKKFVKEFQSHMEEEEAVFRPLLLQNFEPKELATMNETVIRQHSYFRERVKAVKTLSAVKRKHSDVEDADEFDELDLIGVDNLSMKKSYCQEVKDRRKMVAGSPGSSPSSVCKKPAPEPPRRDGPSPPLQLKEQPGQQAGGEALPAATKSPPQPAPIIQKSLELPDEMLISVFSHMCPRSLLACSGVCKRWRRVALGSTLWKAIYPTQWARGCWSFDYTAPDVEDDDRFSLGRQQGRSRQPLSETWPAFSESSPVAEGPDGVVDEVKLTDAMRTAAESAVFEGVVGSLLPEVGQSVTTLILSASLSLENGHVREMLRQVPHVRKVDLSYTRIDGRAFMGLSGFGALRKLEDLNLAGCTNANDELLGQLARCYVASNVADRPDDGSPPAPKRMMASESAADKKVDGNRLRERKTTSHLSRLILSGCKEISSVGISHLHVHQDTLQELDLSGCYLIDGETLTEFVRDCVRLAPYDLYYCNDIEDGPYQDTANGCLNLECSVRFCCNSAGNENSCW